MSCPTTRTHPRTLAEAFADERAYCIECPGGYRMGLSIKTRPTAASIGREFVAVYRQYRAAHGIRYSFATAWNVAVRGLPF